MRKETQGGLQRAQHLFSFLLQKNERNNPALVRFPLPGPRGRAPGQGPGASFKALTSSGGDKLFESAQNLTPYNAGKKPGFIRFNSSHQGTCVFPGAFFEASAQRCPPRALPLRSGEGTLQGRVYFFHFFCIRNKNKNGCCVLSVAPLKSSSFAFEPL